MRTADLDFLNDPIRRQSGGVVQKAWYHDTKSIR